LTPTVFYEGRYRFFFFSREETRMHVHVSCSDGEAKFWLDPIVSLAASYGLTPRQLNRLQKLVEEHKDEIKNSWKEHFKG
jgi:hypothetical protein